MTTGNYIDVQIGADGQTDVAAMGNDFCVVRIKGQDYRTVAAICFESIEATEAWCSTVLAGCQDERRKKEAVAAAAAEAAAKE